MNNIFNKDIKGKHGIDLTIYLFEKDVLEDIEKMNLEEVKEVLTFNCFIFQYQINKKFDNGRADVILMCEHINYLLKIWFKAFSSYAMYVSK